jgi:hypothetical protein
MCLMCAVEALREIATQLGKKDWDFSVNPCNDSSWITHLQMRGHCTTILSTAIAPSPMVNATWLACTLPSFIEKFNIISTSSHPEVFTTKFVIYHFF